MEGRSILSDGLRWSIGNGVSVNIDKDPWIPIPGDFKARRVAIDDNFVTLNQLIHTETMSWKVEEVNRLFVPEHAQCILHVPLSCTYFNDALVWHFSHSGHYNVRLGYLGALDIKGVEPLTEVDGDINNPVGVAERRWKHLWKLNIPRKVGHFYGSVSMRFCLQRGSCIEGGLLRIRGAQYVEMRWSQLFSSFATALLRRESGLMRLCRWFLGMLASILFLPCGMLWSFVGSMR